MKSEMMSEMMSEAKTAILPHTNPRTAMIKELFDLYRDVSRHAYTDGIPSDAVPALTAAVWQEERRLRSISAPYNDLHTAVVKSDRK